MNIAMIRAAQIRLAGRTRATPLLSAPALNALAGRRVLVKPECLQVTGSFKYRGAYAAISAIHPGARSAGVLAYSSGNHAQGVARAAADFAIPAVIVMPSDAPRIKLEATRALGAEVVLFDRATESREEIGAALAAQRSLTLVKPYDDPEVIAGQGTVGLEIAVQARALGVAQADVLVPCGGGGLTAGIALALAADAPGLSVRPVEPEGFDDAARSLASGQIQENNALTGSICDAILTPRLGERTYPIIAKHCGPGLVVSDDEAIFAMAQALVALKIVVEPGGAVALAAALSRAGQIDAETVIVVASGGNADPDRITQAAQTF